MDNASYRYFKVSEFACPCGCGENKIDPTFVLALDALRNDCGIPFHVNSGHRCDKHNAEVGGVNNSAHRANKKTGLSHAADIKANTSAQRFIILKYAGKYFNRIGIGKTFIHLDNVEDEEHAPEVAWMY